MATNPKENLAVISVSSNLEVFESMMASIASTSKTSNWNQILLIFWGPSTKLLISDEMVRSKMEALKSQGVFVKVCKSSAEEFNVIEEIIWSHLDLIDTRDPVKEYQEKGWAVLIF